VKTPAKVDLKNRNKYNWRDLENQMRTTMTLAMLLVTSSTFAQYDQNQQELPPERPAPARTAVTQGARFTAQGMRLGDRPSPAYMAANGMAAADLAKPEFFRRHVIEVPGGEVVQMLCFMHGRLASMSLLYDPDLYDEVVAVWSQRLGRPTVQRADAVGNAFGASFDNPVALWQTDGGLLKVAKYGSGLDKGYGAIFSRAYLEAQKAKSKAGRATAAERF
jgi:hypothetical protein